MIDFRKTFTLAKKEFFSVINSGLAYVVTAPFLAIAIFLYFRTSLIANQANLRPFFELLPWFLLLLAPALSFRLLTNEQRENTLELLFGQPITELEIVLGKFLGVLAFFCLILLTTIGLPITLFIFSRPSLGIIAGQYLGALLIGSTFLSLGIAASAYVPQNIGSFLTAVFSGFLLMLVGFEIVLLILPWPINHLANQLGLLTHVANLSRGLVDIRDVAYFLSLTVLFLLAAVFKLSQRKLAENQQARLKLNLSFLLIISVGIGLNVLTHLYPVRFDLTSQNLLTLSKGTRQTLNRLPDKLKISLYASRNLPGAVQPRLKAVKDLLRDYQRYGQKLNVEIVAPDESSQAASEAKEKGIQPVSFNRLGADSFQVQNGFLGILIEYQDKEEIIPFVNNPADLEYQLTKRIRKLTAEKEKTIGLANLDYSAQFQNFREALETEYRLKSVSLENQTEEDQLDLAALIVIDSGSSAQATETGQLKNYLEKSGRVLVLAEGVKVNPQLLTTTKSESKLLDFLADYGIKIKDDLVYDLQLNETIALSQAGVRYLLPYPFWPKALVVEENLPFSSPVRSLAMGWPSSIDIQEKDNWELKTFLKTSPNAGRQTKEFQLRPEEIETLKSTDQQQFNLGVIAEQGEKKLAVISNTTFLEDRFVQGADQNLALAVGLIDWLASDQELAAIPKKTGLDNPFEFTNSYQPTVVQYLNIVGPVLIVVGFGLFWLHRRKRLARRKLGSQEK